jgi:hypothetical protein
MERSASAVNVTTHNAELKREVDALLAGGLSDVLSEYGSFEIVGSYALGLMVWRDLDIELVAPSFDSASFFHLGGRVAELLRPTRMSYRDETVARSPNLPAGLYWGVHLGDIDGEAWKIDLWSVDASHQRSTRAARDRILRDLKPRSRNTILRIKAEMWSRPGYRRTFSAKDIYDAVLIDGVTDVDGFRNYMSVRNVAV